MRCLIVAPFNIATLRLGGIVWLSLGGFAFKEMVCWFNQKPSPFCWVFSCSRKEKQQWGSRSFRLRVSGQTLFFKPPLLMFYSSASSLEICQRRQQLLLQQQTSNNLLRLFVAWMKVCTTRRLTRRRDSVPLKACSYWLQLSPLSLKLHRAEVPVTHSWKKPVWVHQRREMRTFSRIDASCLLQFSKTCWNSLLQTLQTSLICLRDLKSLCIAFDYSLTHSVLLSPCRTLLRLNRSF